MAIKYLYLDDQDDGTLTSICEAVIGDGLGESLTIDCQHPGVLGVSLGKLNDLLADYDGIILDWRLDQIPQESGEFFSFRAAALAQEIRTRQTEGVLKSVPIILWSTDDKLRNSYTPDLASHDLFDLTQEKIDIAERSNDIRDKLISLSIGYSDINNSRKNGENYQEILGLGGLPSIPLSFNEFVSTFEDEANHIAALQISRKIIGRPGVLVNEALLASRLGIDCRRSKHWKDLLEALSPFLYTGPFGKKFVRWWWDAIVTGWWNGLFENRVSLFSLSANERVELISEKLGLADLAASPPLEDHYSTYYQTICEYYRCPLDKVDGVIIDEADPTPWQDRRYLSLKAALGRLADPKVVKPHPSEFQRLTLLAE